MRERTIKIATVLGARPQFIKASAVSSALAGSGRFEELIVHTGQHHDVNMSSVFFEELGIPEPSVNLDIHGGSHGRMTGRMLEAIEPVLQEARPDILLVYGDTNSTLAGALAAAKLHIPVAHVEAGLRSFNMRMPEEINRALTDRISRLLFAPTAEACRNLANEGYSSDTIVEVGDVMYDVALLHGAKVTRDAAIFAELDIAEGPYVLATIHRAENTDNPERLRAVVEALIAVSREVPIVWPLHPRTRNLLRESAIDLTNHEGIRLTEPVGYLDMVRLERFAASIATDSGGVQKEAFFHGVPCVTLRDETEWVELVAAGWNRLVPPRDDADIAGEILASIGTSGADVNPYGSGDSAMRICRVLECFADAS